MRIVGDWFLVDVIVSRPNNEVLLLAPRHCYQVVRG
jgi:hypothetical protein